MTTDKMRKSFEAAVIERFKESGYLEVEIRTEMLVRDGDDYYDSSVSAYWHFWKASRAAVVVELPEREEGTTLDLDGDVERNDHLIRETPLRAALEAAGLKVVP